MRPPRLPHFDYRGLHRYLLTFCTFQRRPLLVSEQLTFAVIAQFLRAAQDEHFLLPSYCFMPDHGHLLAEGREKTSDLRRFMRMAKQRSEYCVRHFHAGRLWQGGYQDRVLRDEEATLAVARYIVENPVRAGLVISPLDYPFSGSTTLDLRSYPLGAWRTVKVRPTSPLPGNPWRPEAAAL